MEQPKAYRILVVDDDDDIREGVAHEATRMGHEVELAADATQALAKALAAPPDLIITDLNLPDRNGMDLIADLLEHGIDSTLVVLTAFGTIKGAVEATRRGVYDYMIKPVDTPRLRTVITKGLERAAMRKELVHLRREMARSGRYQDLFGRSPSMLELFRVIDQVAPSNAAVLITGESGTGKEVVARTLHAMSPRSLAPFVAINCAALPETLLESELFGHEKGAFTGANATRAGCFEHAHEGTLFLDEIAEMSTALQSKLLRVLEERKVRRLGGSQEISVNIRLLAATNVDVAQMRAQGRFREDLYFRIAVFNLHLPPLRDRREDIPTLAQHFLQIYATENSKPVAGFSEDAMEALCRFQWPGNVRELRNAVQRAVILCRDEEISLQNLPPMVWSAAIENRIAASPIAEVARRAGVEVRIPVGTTLDEAERRIILETLASVAGNKTRASNILGITPKTLYAKLRQYGVGLRPGALEAEAEDGAGAGR